MNKIKAFKKPPPAKYLLHRKRFFFCFRIITVQILYPDLPSFYNWYKATIKGMVTIQQSVDKILMALA